MLHLMNYVAEVREQMSRTIEANIECPFYVKIQGCKLVCEGLPNGCLRTSSCIDDEISGAE